MATLVQLSDTLYLNLDAVTVLRCEDGHWRVWFQDHALALTPEETTVLALYLCNHAERATYNTWRRLREEPPAPR